MAWSPRLCLELTLFYAKDGGSVLGFPVHSAIISAQSPFLSQVIADLKHKGSTEHQPAQLPMMEDDCSAVRSMLACLYGRFPRAHRQQGIEASPTVNVDYQYLRLMRLTHKYGMLGILQDLETSLVLALRRLAVPYSMECNLVLAIAAFAEDCKCGQMLAVCEAIIAKEFDMFSIRHEALSSSLSSASLFRIAQGVNIYRKETISKLDEALQQSGIEARKFCTAHYLHQMICPRCNKALDLSKKCNVFHHDRLCYCRWPASPTTSREQYQGTILVEQVTKNLLQLAEA